MFLLQYRSIFKISNLIGRAVTHSQASLGVKASFRLWFRAGYDVFLMYAIPFQPMNVFSPFSAPPLHHNGERSITTQLLCRHDKVTLGGQELMNKTVLSAYYS